MIERQELMFHIAQLRHAYAQLNRGEVLDQRDFANGLLAPAIQLLERIAAPGSLDDATGIANPQGGAAHDE